MIGGAVKFMYWDLYLYLYLFLYFLLACCRASIVLCSVWVSSANHKKGGSGRNVFMFCARGAGFSFSLSPLSLVPPSFSASTRKILDMDIDMDMDMHGSVPTN